MRKQERLAVRLPSVLFESQIGKTYDSQMSTILLCSQLSFAVNKISSNKYIKLFQIGGFFQQFKQGYKLEFLEKPFGQVKRNP